MKNILIPKLKKFVSLKHFKGIKGMINDKQVSMVDWVK